jgi:hypothetical protein
MIKTIKIVAFLLMTTFSISTYAQKATIKVDNTQGNNAELKADALKFASIACNFQKSVQKKDSVLMMKLNKQGESYSKWIFQKYTNLKDQKEIKDIVKAELLKCK